jgi:N-succinyldiaminopimelate aminotransferase
MNPGFENLQSYPFEKLAALLQETAPADLSLVDLSIGEPKHATPALILDALIDHLQGAGKYPPVKGSLALRETIKNWLVRRYHLPDASLDPEQQILPVNGTREALFAIAHCVIDSCGKDALVVTGNPFYQIYEGAALFAGAGLVYVNNSINNGLLPDYSSVPASVWDKCQLLYICSPNNPTGEIIDQAGYETLFELADRHDFVIAADECYSEIYLDENNPPLGILQAAASAGREDFRRCMVFHSLSKRSNVPGMRSGFVAGDKNLIQHFYRYRTYHGCAMPPFTQAASIAAWNDEAHVAENRRLYRRKFEAVLAILQPLMTVHRPTAGFYLWPETPIDDVEFTRQLIAQQNVRVLPGSFTARTIDGCNPGSKRIRIALVASEAECVEAAERIKKLLTTL